MTIWYLIIAVLLMNGEPAATVAHPFSSQKACEEANLQASADLEADNNIDKYATECKPIDFDTGPEPTEKPAKGKDDA